MYASTSLSKCLNKTGKRISPETEWDLTYAFHAYLFVGFLGLFLGVNIKWVIRRYSQPSERNVYYMVLAYEFLPPTFNNLFIKISKTFEQDWTKLVPCPPLKLHTSSCGTAAGQTTGFKAHTTWGTSLGVQSRQHARTEESFRVNRYQICYNACTL